MTELAVTSDLELVGDLVHIIDRNQVLAADIAADLDLRTGLAIERDLGGVIHNARVLAHAIAVASHRARIIRGDRGLTNVLGIAGVRARHLAEDLIGACASDRAARNTAVDPALTFDGALASTRAYGAARDRGRMNASRLAQDLAMAGSLARDISRDLGISRAYGMATMERCDQVLPARTAARVAGAAAGLLQRRNRSRYALEYQSELADLAAAGMSRLRQVQHAARLLIRTPLLRAALAIARRQVMR